jgi:hypothetical protein
MTPCYWLFLLWIQIISDYVILFVVPSYVAFHTRVKRSPSFIICVHAFVCVCNEVVVCPCIIGYYRYCLICVYCLCTVHWTLWGFGRHNTSAIIINRARRVAIQAGFVLLRSRGRCLRGPATSRTDHRICLIFAIYGPHYTINTCAKYQSFSSMRCGDIRKNVFYYKYRGKRSKSQQILKYFKNYPFKWSNFVIC